MSTKKEYVKLWLSYETYFQSYTPEEIGRLVLAMLSYKDTGEEPVFQGNERFIWPAIQRDINEAADAQETAAQTARENGKKGGRRKSPVSEETEEPQENQPGFSETKENPSGFSGTQKTIRTKDIDKGHCQGQGQGQAGEGRHGAAASSRRGAAGQKKIVVTEAERASDFRAGRDDMEKFLQQLRREAAGRETQDI